MTTVKNEVFIGLQDENCLTFDGEGNKNLVRVAY